MHAACGEALQLARSVFFVLCASQLGQRQFTQTNPNLQALSCTARLLHILMQHGATHGMVEKIKYELTAFLGTNGREVGAARSAARMMPHVLAW